MSQSRVLLEISRGQMKVAVQRGSTYERTASRPIDLPAGEAWEDAFRALVPELAALVAQLGISQSRVTVLYWSPSAATGVFSCARVAGRKECLAAARLALEERAGFSIESNPSSVMVLTDDQPTKGGQADHRHSIGVADLEEAAKAVEETVRASGLIPVELVPIEVPPLVFCVRRVIEVSRSGVAVVLHVGRDCSTLAGAAYGRMRFVRTIAIGTESLVSRLTRDIPAADGGERSIVLEPASARELLMKWGIPAPEEIIDKASHLTGRSVLPLLQPVLQRCTVEIKQSLRFGFDEKERELVHLVGMGGGRTIPHLTEIIGEQCGMQQLACDPGSLAEGPDDCWLRDPCRGINLLPKAAVARTERVALGRGICIGTGAALLLMGAEATLTRMEFRHQEAENAAMTLRLESVGPALEMRRRLIDTEHGLVSAQQRRVAGMGPHVSWESVLAMLSQETPDNIRLQEVQLVIEGGVPICRIRAETPLDQASQSVKSYLERLTSVPIVSSCRLGATQRNDAALRPVQQFEMTLVLVPLPHSTPVAGAMVEGSLP